MKITKWIALISIGVISVFGYCMLIVNDPQNLIDEQKKGLHYKNTLLEIEKKRLELFREYEAVSTEAKKIVIDKAKTYIFKSLTEDVFPSWYDTPWGFYGTSRIPGEGEIACGYFVVTTLLDAGFKLNYSEMADQPSTNIIKNLSTSSNIKSYRNKDIEFIKKEISEWGEGLYMVGLDFHVGFIVYNKDEMRFVHSSYYYQKVISENIDTNIDLIYSSYRIIGKLLDDKMMKKWVMGETFKLKHDYFKR